MGGVSVVRGKIKERKDEPGVFSCLVYFEAKDVAAISAMGDAVDISDVRDRDAMPRIAPSPEPVKPPTQMVAASGVAPQAQKGPAEVELERLIHDPLFQGWADRCWPAEVSKPGDSVQLAKMFVGMAITTGRHAGMSREASLADVLSNFRVAVNG